MADGRWVITTAIGRFGPFTDRRAAEADAALMHDALVRPFDPDDDGDVALATLHDRFMRTLFDESAPETNPPT